MNVPRPPTWLMIAIVIVMFIGLGIHASRGATLPYYHGRPPPGGIRHPYKCFCQFHGPHGGCIKWVCPKKRPTKPSDGDKQDDL